VSGRAAIRPPSKGQFVGTPSRPCVQIDTTPAIFQHIRQLLWVREVRSGFQEEHAAVRVLGQAGRQNAAGGAATDDNGVVTHAISFALWSSSWPQRMLGARAVATATIPGDARGRTPVCVRPQAVFPAGLPGAANRIWTVSTVAGGQEMDSHRQKSGES